MEQEVNNLDLYNKVRSVPLEAKKPIQAGRLKGMTDINPMWRIKTLTENFGLCGIGWKTTIEKMWLEDGALTERMAFVHLKLFIKVDGVWSDGIDGIGGSTFVAKENAGMHNSDECFKMAYTDAISVACKALGFGADVYFEKDRTKYDQQISDEKKPKEEPKTEVKDEASEQKAKDNMLLALTEVKESKTVKELTAVWNKWNGLQAETEFSTACTSRRLAIQTPSK